MKKQIVSVLAAMCLTAAVATPSFAEMTVSTDGSTSMEKVIGSLGEAFSNKYDDVTFTYNPTGSGSGITAAQEGRCDIGLSSRALKADEAKTLDGTTLALDGIVVVVNPANKVNDLSIDQISKIFKGEVTSWKDVGGADTPIVLIGREAGSGTRDGFETITNTKDSCKYRQELTSTGDVMTVVSKNENAIGYISLASMNDKVKGVTVEGVAATEPSIADGTYKIHRPFVLVTKKGAQLSEGAQKFIDFAFSEEAKPILIKAGVVPVAKK